MRRVVVVVLALLLTFALSPGSVLAHGPAGHWSAPVPAPEPVGVEETHEGELEVLHEDGTDSRYLYFLNRGGGNRLSLNFWGQQPALQTGDRVRVKGVRQNAETLAVGTSGGTLSLVSAAPLPNTFGAQRALVILVKFQDKPTATYASVSQVQNIMFQASNPTSVTNFYRETSYQQTWFTGDVVGPYVIPVNSTTCDYVAISNYGRQAASAAGFNVSSYTRLIYAFPSNACGWWGLGTVGGSPSHAWINGTLDTAVASHELGHNLGLWHSHALECGSVPIGGSCSSLEYGDTLDVMGWASPPRHFNAVQKDFLGWLGYGSSPPITTVQSSGVYTIDPYEPVGPDPKALKVRTSFGDWYYVEFRQLIGFDVGLTTNVVNGVVIHYWAGQGANSIYLLDMTPATASWSDPALTVGQSFTDSAAGITISPVSVGSAGAAVNVTLAGSCVRRNPTLTVAPAQQGATAGTMLTYTVSVRNNDDAACSTSAFSTQANTPTGWTATLSPATLTISPGATVATALSVTSPSSVSAGNYTIGPTASNTAQPIYTASTTATYSVAASGGGGGGGSGGAGAFTDNFDRADSSSLGNGWAQVQGNLMINSGRATNAPTVNIHMATLPGLAGPTQTVAASFASVDSNGGPRFGLVVRYTDAQNYYMCYRLTGATSALRISRVVNGVEKVLKQAAIANPTRNVFFGLGCQVQGTGLGTQISLQFNGATKISVSDSTFSTGSVGLLMGYLRTSPKLAKSQLADNFSANVQ